MRLAYKTLVAAVLVLGIAADSLKWMKGTPRWISTSAPYVSHLEVETDGRRTLYSRLLDSRGQQLAFGVLEISGAFHGAKSVFIDFPTALPVGNSYRVVNQLTDGGGSITASDSQVHVAVYDRIDFQDDFDTVPPQQPFTDLEITYTAARDAYLVVAIKDELDLVYLGSSRHYVPAGRDVSTTIRARFTEQGRRIVEGTKMIIRIDIRAPNTPARERFDRIEKVVTASSNNPRGFSVRFSDRSPGRLNPCTTIAREISYEAPDGPVMITLKLFDSDGRWVKGQRARNLAAGARNVRIRLRLIPSDIVPGERYEFRTDIRRMSATDWRDILAESNEPALIPGVAC
ncbi:hypothetical protein NDN08_005300 [Rhodosorus marinus]|uniref:Uncharacterized protein n=1 Tax=Rhodosorus marinus TaxID=101924 RepID=A0AAV8V163_9RHOD|nr:hypothetical protein NDN08_005300 [Rhodosorus marinus]